MFATLYLPNFYLQAATRHQPLHRGTAVPAVRKAGFQPVTMASETLTGHTDKMSVPQPVALIEEQDSKPVIIQLNHAAESAGVRKGMTPSQALARCLHVVIKVRERAQEKLVDEILLQHVFTLSPFVEATAPGICTIQFTKWHRHPADDSWAESPCYKLSRVIEQLAKCEITAQAGIAHLPDTSFLAAHLARPVLQIDDAREFLAPLPIETLATALT